MVLQSVPEPRPTTNPYVVQLVAALRGAGAEVRTFSWRAALASRYDVFHVHWPEVLARGSTPVRTLLRQLALLALLLRCRLGRTPIVRTYHNPAQHEEASRRERWLLALFERWTSYGIRLNDQTALRPGLPAATIPHGHYRDWYARFGRAPAVPRRLAYVGLIRPYKGVEDLLEAFADLPGPDWSLTVSGSPRTAELAADLRRRAADDLRVRLELAYVSEEELVQRLTEAELVVLPYREMHNSGAALAALSLDRPVLVPRNAVTSRLAEEVGPGWVCTFAGSLTADVLLAALTEARGPRSTRPDLSARTWAQAGVAHLEAYAAAVATRRG